MDYYDWRRIGQRTTAVLIYRFGFSAALATGDKAQSVVVVADAGITAQLVETGDDYAKVKLSGGAVSMLYAVELLITTQLGEVIPMAVYLETPEK